MKCVLLGASTVMCFSLRTFSPCILHTNSAITHPQTLSRGGGGGLLSPAAANTAHLNRTFSLFFSCYPRVPLFTAQLKYHTYHKNCLYYTPPGIYISLQSSYSCLKSTQYFITTNNFIAPLVFILILSQLCTLSSHWNATELTAATMNLEFSTFGLYFPKGLSDSRALGKQ